VQNACCCARFILWMLELEDFVIGSSRNTLSSEMLVARRGEQVGFPRDGRDVRLSIESGVCWYRRGFLCNVGSAWKIQRGCRAL
jgi:hypothetical protein